MRTGQGFMCCYAINSRSSFDEIQNAFYPQILRVKDRDWVPVVLVGNKCDLDSERQVTTAEGEELARRYKAPFFETSALRRIVSNFIPFFFLCRTRNLIRLFFRTSKRLSSLWSVKYARPCPATVLLRTARRRPRETAS
jgi:GTPase SAR1 family protein